MARSTIQRQLHTTHVTYQTIVKDGNASSLSKPHYITLEGKLKENVVYLRLKHLIDDEFTVNKIEHETAMYKMELDDFIKHANKTNIKGDE